MKLDDLPTTPGLPELIESECKKTGGVDLLGLRILAEHASQVQLSGITTVTGTVRYLSLYALIVQQYFQRGGIDNNASFIQYAKKVEAAFVMGNQLMDRSMSGLVGPQKGGKQVDSDAEKLTLGSLVDNPASGTYATSARDLGITWDRPNVPGLTVERGGPLADAVAAHLKDTDVLEDISLDTAEQDVDRARLRTLGELFPLSRPTGDDRRMLIDAIMPVEPREEEVSRLRTYCMLLQIATNAGSMIRQDDVYNRIVRPSLKDIPPCLHTTYDGWVPFVTRDMLVAVHEAAVSVVTCHLETIDHPGRRQSINSILEQVTAETDEMLPLLKLTDLSSSDPISRLADTVIKQLGHSEISGSIRRWSGHLIEPHVATLAVGSQDFNPIVLLLPIAWLLAYERHRPEGTSTDDRAFAEGMHGQTHMGTHSVISLEVATWHQSDRTIREVVADLVRRSVDQHLRIAWSRLSREPWKDVSVIASDGNDWIYIKRLSAGRTASRLGQTIGWLRQLDLIGEDGITEEGHDLLSNRLSVLDGLDLNQS